MVVKNKEGVIKSYFQGQGNVKTSNNSLSTSDKGYTLYSYNTPIAYSSPSRKGIYLNKDKYSSTTSSQQNLFRAEAKSQGIKYQEVDSMELEKARSRE